jgi:nucleoside-diphosphate-sugar epimerase
MASERLLVTGATGFVGAAIVKHALASGYRVRAFSRRPDDASAAHEHVTGDILDARALSAAMQGVDGVIHAAALAHIFSASPKIDRQFELINHTGAANVVHAAVAAGVRRYVLVSSVSVYGRAEQARNEDAACHPDGAYGRSKLRAEHATIDAVAATGTSVRIVRLSTVYGEQDPGNVSRLIRSIARGRFVWLGDGSNRKSLIYRDDAAAACLAALRHPDALPPLNVTAPAVTMNELVSTIALAVGRRVPGVRIPAALGRWCAAAGHTIAPRGPVARAAGAIEKWLGNDEYDGRRFEAATGYRCAVSLNEGIAREVRWLRHLAGTS